MYSLNADTTATTVYNPYGPSAAAGVNPVRSSAVSVGHVTTEQRHWNGTQWVENAVTLYTKYYHGWDAIAKDATRPDDQKAWAKYNADLASYAAHYFFNNPSTTQPPPELTLPPAPPSPSAAANTPIVKSPSVVVAASSPPAYYATAAVPQQQHRTPTATNSFSHANNYSSNHSYRSNTTTTPGSSSSSASSSSKGDGMRRYMDRCLALTKTEADRNEVTVQIRQMIQQILSKGVGLNTIDWDAQPLVRLPGVLSSSSTAPLSRRSNGDDSSSSSSRHRPTPETTTTPASSNHHSYYGAGTTSGGPSSSQHSLPNGTRSFSTSPIPMANSSRKNKPLNYTSADSYYGPTPAARRNSSGSDEQSKNSSSSSNKRVKTKITSSPANSTAGSYYGSSKTNDFQQMSLASKDFIAFSSETKKKRKTTEESMGSLQQQQQQAPPQVPWSTGKIKNGFDRSTSTLNDRASRFAGRGGLADISSTSKSTTNYDKYKGAATIGGSNKKLDEQDYERMTVKGTCKTLEKAYLRLTAPPKAEQVRPRRILKQHLSNLKAERNQASRRDYLWFCSQFKAIRQDCTVQRIQDALTVDVYETHARVALEESDMNEFNQCQTQLIQLYKRLTYPVALRNQNEFLAYRILYQTFVVMVNGAGTSDLLKTMLSATHSQQQQEQSPILRHALAVRRASSGGNYHAFFRLYRECPTIWAEYLMDGLVAAVRFQGLKCIAKSYRPAPVAVDFVLQQLGLWQQHRGVDDDDEEKEELLTYGRNWLISCGCKLSKDGADLLTNETEVHQSTLDDKQSLI